MPGEGGGLVISVTLDDPGSDTAQVEVLGAIERTVQYGPGQEFPIDVTFPGEGEPDQVDTWIAAHAEPFYIRGNSPASQRAPGPVWTLPFPQPTPGARSWRRATREDRA